MIADRKAIAEQLVKLERKIRVDVASIELLKEQLRAIALKDGEGFKETIAVGDTVTVSAGSEERFKGILPVLSEEAYMNLPAHRRRKLEEERVVTMERQYSRGTKPSVKVTLAP